MRNECPFCSKNKAVVLDEKTVQIRTARGWTSRNASLLMCLECGTVFVPEEDRNKIKEIIKKES